LELQLAGRHVIRVGAEAMAPAVVLGHAIEVMSVASHESRGLSGRRTLSSSGGSNAIRRRQ
jgi:hypothetical protein